MWQRLIFVHFEALFILIFRPQGYTGCTTVMMCPLRCPLADRFWGPRNKTVRSAATLVPCRMSGMSVAAIQHQGFHFEVLAAVLYTFAQLESNVTAYTGFPALDMQHVIKAWYPVQFRQHDAFEPVSCEFDVVVLVTFPEGHEKLAEHIGSKACASGQQFIVIVHNPGNLRSPGEDCHATTTSHTSEFCCVELQRDSNTSRAHCSIASSSAYPQSCNTDFRTSYQHTRNRRAAGDG